MLQLIQVNAAKMNRHLLAISSSQALNLEIKEDLINSSFRAKRSIDPESS